MKRTLLVCAVFSVSLCDGLAAANVQQTSHKAACAIKVTDYGASGDDRNLDSEPIQRAIDDCARLGGGEVRFPRGVYRVGTLHLRSNVSVVLEEGSVLRGSEDLDDYLEPLTRNGVDKSHFVSGTGSRRLFLYGDHVENVSIRGKGTIDGNQVREKSGTRGPLTILIQHSSNVVLDGITVTRSPGWSVTFFDCQHVRVLGVKLKDVMADGINPVSCQDVLYDGVVIDGTGDDPICIKNEGPPLRGGYVTRDVTIRNTVVRNTSHPGFKIGTGTNGTFDRVVVEDSTFERVGDLFAIQLMRPSQTGEAERFIRNIWMRRVRASNTKRFLDITAIGVGQPVISGVHFEDVQIDGRVVGSRILGTNASPIEDITIRNVVAVANESSESWLQTRNVGRLTLDHVTIDVPGTKTILAADTGRGLKLDSIRVRGLLPDGPALHLADVQDAEIGTITTPHLKNLVWVAGARAAKIRLKQADWSQVENPLLAADDVAEQALLPAANAKVLSLSAPARIKPNEALQVNAQVQNAGPAGVTPLTLFAGDRVAGRKWIWIGTAGKKTVTITGNPFYVPGSYALNLGGFVRKLRVMRTPAHFQYGTFCEMDTPAAPGATTKVVVPVRNIGGTTGKHVVELKVSGKPFVS
ncbi:MAG: glycosyl hydrolase family 28-related protein, partial [Bryobacteraceae bacterium]